MTADLPPDATLRPDETAELQRRKLGALLAEVRRSNPFYRTKLAGTRSDALDTLPFTTRDELQRDQQHNPPYGSNLTCPLEKYSRLHQTSGSGGHPLRWLDTTESWEFCKRCWAIIYAGAELRPDDRLLFPFSFGPFLGFWAAFESACALGNLCFAAGGMTTTARLRSIFDNKVSVLCCTPTYALRMAEVAAEEGLDLAAGPVRALIVAGEPGGNIPATRARIESLWGARVFDHAGMTEIGPWGFETIDAPGGMFVIESEFIAEVIDPQSERILPEGEPGELVLTNLGRVGSPLIRYRTGDQVRLIRRDAKPPVSWLWAERGVLGRIDDMLIVRGNNVFPSAIEGILREFDDVAEFRIEVKSEGALADLRIDVELRPSADAKALVQRIGEALRDRLHFRSTITAVEPGALPRFDMKAKRITKM